jgi:hypothetical protein
MSDLDRRTFLIMSGAVAAGSIAAGDATACGFEKTARTARLAPRFKPVANWVLADFEPLVGTPFDIDGRMLVLEEIRKGPETPSQFREQFALVFESGKVGDMESRIRPVRHPALGTVDLYVNIVRYMDTGRTAEIYFS